MRRRPSSGSKRRTAWHPLFVRALRYALPSTYFRILPEYHLHHQPLRLDAVVVRKKGLPATFRPTLLASLVEFLGDHTIIELKGSTDQLDWSDFLRLLAYAPLYCLDNRLVDLGRLRLMVVASRLTDGFRAQAERYRGRFLPLGPGVHQVEGLDYVLFCIETEVVSDHVLHLFSRSFLRDPLAQVPLLTEEERAIFLELFDEVQQFKKDPQALVRYADYEEIAMSWEEFAAAILPKLSPEERLKGLSPEERLKGLPAEDIVKVLSPEERLHGLSPEERVEGLSPEERVEGLSPEERERVLKKLLDRRP